MSALRIAVIGGGMAGLSCARRLQSRGAEVVCYEADSAPGGVVRTSTEEGFTYEHGPHTVLASARHLDGLIDELGIRARVRASESAARARYIVREGRLRALPSRPQEVLSTSALSWGGKLRFLGEPLVRAAKARDEHESVATFFERRFGREACEYFADPFVSGIHAGDVHQLEVASAFPVLVELEQAYGSLLKGMLAKRKQQPKTPKQPGLLSFDGGLGELPQTLATALGDALRLSSPVDQLERNGATWRVTVGGESGDFDQIVLATPAFAAARLVRPLSDPLATSLEAIPYAPIALVHLGYREGDCAIPHGFGVLIPRNQQIQTLGAIFVSRLFPERAPGGHLTLACFIGGALDPTIMERDDAAIRAQVIGDLTPFLGLHGEPVWAKVLRYPRAIPQYTIGHRDRVATIESQLRELPGLHLAGNYLRGISLDATVGEGLRIATELTVEG